MIAVIGTTLPLALGIAISPMAIIAAVLMLLSPKARATGSGFVVGWLLGAAVATTVVTMLAGLLPAPASDGSSTTRGIIHLLLGLLLLALAVRQWRSRPKPGVEPELPKWMRALDTVPWPGALAFGFLLAGVSPKNFLLAADAGVEIAAAALPVGEIVIVIAVFTVLAASTVLVPVVAYLVAADRLRTPLAALRGWLAAENAIIMAILLLVLGVMLVGKGIASF